MHSIGITGGIGSGKSYVAHFIQRTYGLPLYDCDTRARQLMTSSPEIRGRLTALLGGEAYNADGTLNRPFVADFLFRNETNAAAINAIVHPVVRCDWLAFAAQSRTPVLMESALLVEAGMADTVDVVVLVTAPEELRIERAMRRDKATREQVMGRMARQMREEELRSYANYVIINDGSPMEPQITKLINNTIKSC